MSRQHLFRSCLGLALFAGCLSGCVAPLTPSSAYTPPSHGNQYYSREAAKFLGSDNVDSVSYRLIDSVTFENILRTCNSLTSARATRTLLDSSCLITLDSARIQAELQLIRDSSTVSAQNLYIGETWGTKRANTGLTINLGLDALRIWGKSQAPDFKCIAAWNKAILTRDAPAHDLEVIHPLTP